MLPGAPGHIAVPAVYSPSGGGSNEMYQEAQFFRGNEGKKFHLGSAARSSDGLKHKT